MAERLPRGGDSGEATTAPARLIDPFALALPLIFAAAAASPMSAGAPGRAITSLAPTPLGPQPGRRELSGEVGEMGAPPQGLELDRTTPRLPLDICETPTAFFMRVDCAGCAKEAVAVDVGVRTRDVRVTAHRLSGKAAQAEECAKGCAVVRFERPTGSSCRRVVFPSNADLDHIETGYEDGLLLLRIPKTRAEPETRRQVAIE